MSKFFILLLIGQDYLLIMADKQVFILEGDQPDQKKMFAQWFDERPKDKVLLAFSTNSDVRTISMSQKPPFNLGKRSSFIAANQTKIS